MALYDALQKRLNKTNKALLSEAGKTDTGASIASIQQAAGGKATSAPTGQPSLAEQSAASGAVQDVKTAAAATGLQAQALGMAEQAEAANTALGEQQLAEQLRQGQQGLAAQATTQRANLASGEKLAMDKLQSTEEMKRDTITSQAEQAVANLLSNKKISENDIFASFAQDERELEFRRDQASIEQLGTMLALRDRAYVDELERVGRQRNLDDQQGFEKEAARLALGDQTALYLEKLEWTEADLVDNLRFAEKMSQMDINQAWALLKMASDAANASMIASGATTILGAGAQYAMQPTAPVTAAPASQNTRDYSKAYGEA